MSVDVESGSCFHLCGKIVVLVEHPGLAIGIISPTGEVSVNRCIHQRVIILGDSHHHTFRGRSAVGSINGQHHRIFTGKRIGTRDRIVFTGRAVTQFPDQGMYATDGGSIGEGDHVVTLCRGGLGERYLVAGNRCHPIQRIVIHFLRTTGCHDKKEQHHPEQLFDSIFHNLHVI